MKSHISELVLVVVLVLLVLAVRVYYGGHDGLMIVWKGELGFKDTLVNLPEVMALPKAQLTRDHKSVLWQLEEMGLMEPDDLPEKTRKRLEKRTPDNAAAL